MALSNKGDTLRWSSAFGPSCLSAIPNILDDATEALGDEVIYPFLAENPQTGNYSNVAYMFLFQAIVELSNGTPVDPKYLDFHAARVLITTLQSRLIAMLGAVWKGRSYHDIQNLGPVFSANPLS